MQQPAPPAAVGRYYSRLARRHGATPWGVDWTCDLTQRLRFIQLMKVTGRRRRFSINDLGCGYGALLPFLRDKHGAYAVDYLGIDLSAEQVGHAQALWDADPVARFEVGDEPSREADFSVASGVFNVQLGLSDAVWHAWVATILHGLAAASRVGFAVNFILPPQPGLDPLPGLYRTSPRIWATHCRQAYGMEVTTVEGYGLREFTLLARWPGLN